MTKNLFHPSLLLLYWDPGTEIRDPGLVKIRIREKLPGSATLFFGSKTSIYLSQGLHKERQVTFVFVL
jgi:hypothetical protein